MKIADGQICGPAVEVQRSAAEFYRKCDVCFLNEPPFAVRLNQNIPATFGTKLDVMRCYLADLGARTCLIEPRSMIVTKYDARDLPSARPELKAGIST